MLGWYITAYRFNDPPPRAARCDLESMTVLLADSSGTTELPDSGDKESRIAVWQTLLGGTSWLDELVSQRNAAKTSRGGYPESYLVRFVDFEEQLAGGLLRPGMPWRSGPGDTFLPGYLGSDTAFSAVLNAVDSEEWILVVAWDES